MATPPPSPWAPTPPFPWEPQRPCLSPPHCIAQAQFPRGQGTLLPIQMSLSYSQGLTALERKAAGPGLPLGLSPVVFPLHCQGIPYSGFRAEKNPTELCNEPSTLGTPVLSPSVPEPPVPWLAHPILSQSSISLGQNSPCALPCFTLHPSTKLVISSWNIIRLLRHD